MIEIKNVSTSYTKGKKIIDNMNLKIEFVPKTQNA